MLTKDVRQLENTYRKLYAPVQEMSELYTACKNEVVFFRYKSLKEMIKTCINTYEQLKKDEKVKSEKGENNLKGAGAFLDVATETKEIMAGKRRNLVILPGLVARSDARPPVIQTVACSIRRPG